MGLIIRGKGLKGGGPLIMRGIGLITGLKGLTAGQ